MITIEGLPGSFLDSGVKKLRWIRGPDVPSGIPGHAARTYDAEVDDGKLRAVVSQDQIREGPRWHISVSHRTTDGRHVRLPTWDELKHAKYMLVPVDCAMVLIITRKKLPESAPYVDLHPTTLHLWEARKGIDE